MESGPNNFPRCSFLFDISQPLKRRYEPVVGVFQHWKLFSRPAVVVEKFALLSVTALRRARESSIREVTERIDLAKSVMSWLQRILCAVTFERRCLKLHSLRGPTRAIWFSKYHRATPVRFVPLSLHSLRLSKIRRQHEAAKFDFRHLCMGHPRELVKLSDARAREFPMTWQGYSIFLLFLVSPFFFHFFI